nr:YchJ family metal-binding protein [Austwickia sp. TVS 96-490-7B]
MSGASFGDILSTNRICPCGGWPAPGTTYGECCGALHDGSRRALTAEALMRSRYSAFAVGDPAYLLRTWHARTRPEDLHLDPEHQWVGLEILASEDGQAHHQVGTVTYRAHSRGRDGQERAMTERSRFMRRAGKWVYVDGDMID